MTAAAQKRIAARRAEARTRGPSDNPEDRGLFERCITRGVPAGLLPGPYNNNLQIVQTPAFVVLFTEMIHDARIVPMDGRPHAGARIRDWLGDSRGHWDGDTLVVDTTNFREENNFRGSGEKLHLVERFTRLDADTLEYRFTVEDPSTWMRPWTVSYPMVRTEGPIYEYACHEGNYGLMNILSGARFLERAAGARVPKEK
jgi:hypothetical protein